MFKFTVPMMTVLLSSGSLLLLAIGSLLLASNTVYTSDIQISDRISHNQQANQDIQVSNSLGQLMEQVNNSSKINEQRRRSGRLYSQTGYSGGSQQASSLESYAAAYAAANGPSSVAGQSLDGTVGNVQSTSDQSGYLNSFGEPISQTTASNSPQLTASSPLRQLAADYVAPHSSYYANYMSPSSSATSYSEPQSTGGYSSSYYSHYPKSGAGSLQLGYPSSSRHHSTPYYDRAFLEAAQAAPLWAGSSSSSGLMSSASNVLSHWTGGFGISEIICALVAIAIGAVILGAPFFLIYLALMGNFSGSGTLSLTNPAQTTTTTGGATTAPVGRRKRMAVYEQFNNINPAINQVAPELAMFADSVVEKISPFVDLRQVSMTFKRLVDSIEKYSSHSSTKKNEAKKKKTF